MSYLPHLRKLRKLKRQNPTPLEDEVAKAIYDLELKHKTLRLQLPRFHINTAKEVESARFAKKGLVVFYPLRYLMLVRKIQKTLTAELEKRFPGRIAVLVAQRKITKRPKDVYKLQKVQRSRTATAVNEAILDDLLAPCDIVVRRWKCSTDGAKMMKYAVLAQAVASSSTTVAAHRLSSPMPPYFSSKGAASSCSSPRRAQT